MDYRYGYFESTDMGQLYNAFVESFSDYYVNFHPNISQFYHRIFHKLNASRELSGLVFENDDVIGFILHALNDYQGTKVAYNGGTGIIPSKRKNKVMTGLYEMLMPRLHEHGAEKILLEVIADNSPAVSFYKSLGFEYTRVFKCFKTYESYEVESIKDVNITRSFQLKSAYEKLWDFTPSFLDNTSQLAYNMNNEIILEALLEDNLVGYIIFQPAVGRISQLAVSDKTRGKGVGLTLLQAAQALSRKKNITLMNIPEDEHSTIEKLEKLGFKNEVTQYEMELRI
jgi:ribosomal protein S18 acetylase RimI-like enzyme